MSSALRPFCGRTGRKIENILINLHSEGELLSPIPTHCSGTQHKHKRKPNGNERYQLSSWGA
jgi:hypothetical protein